MSDQKDQVEEKPLKLAKGFPKTVYADFAHGTVHRHVNSKEEFDEFLAQGWREE